ncbi:uncharacterized protein LOC135371450 [Ornithodoros turicata]|uniref:uncharacterized protein LOC135371450 n=1 Tax=Ornithodoros turicata TaxID=34597 RepID=UPI003138BE38
MADAGFSFDYGFVNGKVSLYCGRDVGSIQLSTGLHYSKMPNAGQISCPRCQWKVFTLRALFRHLCSSHSHEKNWVCGLQGCVKTYQSYFRYRQHVTAKHGDLLGHFDSRASSEQGTENEGGEEGGQPMADAQDAQLNIDEGEAVSPSRSPEAREELSQTTPDSTKRFALLLLKWKEEMRLPESTLNEVANDITLYLEELAQQASDTPDGGTLENTVKQLPMLQTKYGREQYWKGTLPFVQPSTICLENKPDGKTISFHYISLLRVLKMYLECPQVPDICEQQGREGRLTTVFDGTAFQNHKYFQGDKKKLCIQLYTDEFEPCDPLGAKRGKHKLMVVYYSVLNVPPELRSRLQHMHLALIVKDKLVEQYGLRRILQPLLEDVRQLETEGIVVNSVKYTGSVLCVTGDNLSSHRLGGFATNFSHGRICRFCMALHHEISIKHKEQDFVMRSPEGQRYHVNMLENGLPALSLYGVKASCAMELEGFEPTEHLPPDVMHDVHEGVIPFLLKHVLTKLVSDRYFSLDTLNDCIEKFPYDPCDRKNKPEIVHRAALTTKGTLKGSASQKFCLFRNVALYIGECIPSENSVWKLYLIFREIVDIIMCRDLPSEYVPYLHRRIEFFRQEFNLLFPEVRVPCKMHYLLHYPTFISKYGPLVGVWSMRFEGKHQYFKDVTRKIKNFKNLSSSLANRHQLYQMYTWTQQAPDGIMSTKCCKPLLYEHAPEALQLYLTSHGINEDQIVSMKSMELSGRTYVTDCIVTSQVIGDELPEFQEVCGIYSVSRRILLLLRKLVTLEFDKHLHVFVVDQSTDTFVADSPLDYMSDLLKVHRKGNSYVINPRQALL